MIPTLSAMSPADASIPHTLDFSSILDAGDTIATITGVTATPATLTIGTPAIVTGARAACAVQVALGGGTAVQTYAVTADIVTANGQTFARSVFVPVANI